MFDELPIVVNVYQCRFCTSNQCINAASDVDTNLF